MALDNLITRFPNGLNNVLDNGTLTNLKIPSLTSVHQFFEDFDRYTAAQWSVGGVNPVAPALAAGDGGVLSMATTGANGDSNFVQQAANAWTLSSSKRVFASFRFQVDSALNAAIAAGFQVTVAANNFLTPADGLFIRKAAAGTSFVLAHRVSGVEIVSSAFGTLADNTSIEISLASDGSNVVAGVNGVNAVSITVPTYTVVVQRLTFGVQAGTAAARTALLDQIFAVKDR